MNSYNQGYNDGKISANMTNHIHNNWPDGEHFNKEYERGYWDGFKSKVESVVVKAKNTPYPGHYSLYVGDNMVATSKKNEGKQYIVAWCGGDLHGKTSKVKGNKEDMIRFAESTINLIECCN